MSKLTTLPAKQQTEYLRAVPSNVSEDQRNILQRPTWVPGPWVPARPGADDHKQYTSKGTR